MGKLCESHDVGCRIPAAVSTLMTSCCKESWPSLFPLLWPLPRLPLPFGRPRVGIPIPGEDPAGVMSVINWA